MPLNGLNLRQQNPQQRTAIFFVSILLCSSLLNISVADVNSTPDLSTNGDFLLLDSENSSIVSIDLETLMDTNDLANSVTAVNQLMKQNSSPTGLTHDQNNLFVSYEDGTLEVYTKIGDSSKPTLWTKTSDVQLNPAASSLTLVGQGSAIAWTSLSDALIRQVPRTDLSSQPTIEDNFGSDVNSGGLQSVVFSGYEGLRPIFMGLDERGDTVLGTAVEPPIESGIAGERIWVRDVGQANGQSSSPVSAIANLNVIDNDSPESVYIAVDSESIRILSREPAYEISHRFNGNLPPGYNASTMNFAITDVLNGELQSHSVLKMSRSSMNAASRCFPITIPFADLQPFTISDNQSRVEGGSVTLSIGGVEREVTWDDISGQTVEWAPGEKDSIFEGLCSTAPEHIEFKITNVSDPSLDALISLHPPSIIIGEQQNWERKMMVQSHTSAISNVVHSSQTSPTFGSDSFSKERKFIAGNDLDFNLRDVTDISVIQPEQIMLFGYSDDAGEDELNETVVLTKYRPVQSVWEPRHYTQEKSVWWEIDFEQEVKNGRDTIDVELLVRGMNCSGGVGLAVDVSPTATLHDTLMPHTTKAISPTAGVSADTYDIPCASEFRKKGSWEPVEPHVEYALAGIPGSSSCKFETEDYVRVYSLRFEVSIDAIDKRGSMMIPFDVSNSKQHQERWVRPAPSNTDCWLPRSSDTADIPKAGLEGTFMWKIVVDPDNKLNDTDFTDGSHSHPVETDYSIPFVDDVYRVLIVPTNVQYYECKSWRSTKAAAAGFAAGLALGGPALAFEMAMLGAGAFWDKCDHWFTEDEMPGNFLAAPSRERALKIADDVSMKMEEMFPIPNGKLSVDVSPTYDFRYTESEHIAFTSLIEKTASYFSLMEIGSRVGLDHDDPPDRVVMLVNGEVADSKIKCRPFGTSDDWKSFFELGYIHGCDRIGGLVVNSGMSPCSRSSIVSDRGAPHPKGYRSQTVAETVIHEIGHSLLLGHDNNKFFDHTLNDCGVNEGGGKVLYRPNEGAFGWSSISPAAEEGDLFRQNTGKYWNGQSFMKYQEDGERFDDDFNPCHYEYTTQDVQFERPKSSHVLFLRNKTTGEYETFAWSESREAELAAIVSSDTDLTYEKRTCGDDSGTWIQNADYEYLQDGLWYQTEDYMAKYFSEALYSLANGTEEFNPLDLIPSEIISDIEETVFAWIDGWFDGGIGELLEFIADILFAIVWGALVMAVVSAIIGLAPVLKLGAVALTYSMRGGASLLGDVAEDGEYDVSTAGSSTSGRTVEYLQATSMQFDAYLLENGESLGGGVKPIHPSIPVTNLTANDEGYRLLIMDANGNNLSNHELFEVQGVRDVLGDVIPLRTVIEHHPLAAYWALLDSNGNPIDGGSITLLGETIVDAELNESISGTSLDLEWFTEGSEFSNVEYELYESFDNGTTWGIIASGLRENRTSVDLSHRSITDSYRIGVVASDGFKQSTAISESFLITHDDQNEKQAIWKSTNYAHVGDQILVLIESPPDAENCDLVESEHATEILRTSSEGNLIMVGITVSEQTVNGAELFSTTLSCDEQITFSATTKISIQGGVSPITVDEEPIDEDQSHSHDTSNLEYVDFGDEDWLRAQISPLLRDTDGDGVRDAADSCPSLTTNVDETGCAIQNDVSADEDTDKSTSANITNLQILILSTILLLSMIVVATRARRDDSG